MRYSGKLWFDNAPISPLVVIAMRVNKKSNSCEGVVIGIDWKSMFADTGIDYRDFAPPGGKSNPVFFLSRVRLSQKLDSMDMSKKLNYIKEIKNFFGQAALTKKLTVEGVDPYAVIWGL